MNGNDRTNRWKTWWTDMRKKEWKNGRKEERKGVNEEVHERDGRSTSQTDYENINGRKGIMITIAIRMKIRVRASDHAVV